MSAWTAVIPNSFGMFLIVMQWISHCVQWQIDSVGVFVWAPAPFCGFCFVCAVCFAVSAGETQVWLGDLRVVVFGLVVVFVFVVSIDFDSNVYRIQNLSKNAVESQAKNKSSLAKCLSGTGLCHAIRSENFKIQVLPTLPTKLTSPLLRLATAAYAEKYGSMTSRWCRVLAPILPLSRGLSAYP